MRGGEVLHEATLGLAADGSPRHSTALLAEVERAAEASGGWEQVGRIAVGRGPGSFVGIRIGLATAGAWRPARACPPPASAPSTRSVVPYASKQPAPVRLCPPWRGRAPEAWPCSTHAAARSSRRSTQRSGERLWEPFVAAPEALAARVASLCRRRLRAAGSGAVRFRQELADRDLDIPDDADPVHRVSARHICALVEATGYGDGDSLDPIYLRPPDAQRWRERDTSQRAE